MSRRVLRIEGRPDAEAEPPGAITRRPDPGPVSPEMGEYRVSVPAVINFNVCAFSEAEAIAIADQLRREADDWNPLLEARLLLSDRAGSVEVLAAVWTQEGPIQVVDGPEWRHEST